MKSVLFLTISILCQTNVTVAGSEARRSRTQESDPYSECRESERDRYGPIEICSTEACRERRRERIFGDSESYEQCRERIDRERRRGPTERPEEERERERERSGPTERPGENREQEERRRQEGESEDRSRERERQEQEREERKREQEERERQERERQEREREERKKEQEQRETRSREGDREREERRNEGREQENRRKEEREREEERRRRETSNPRREPKETENEGKERNAGNEPRRRENRELPREPRKPSRGQTRNGPTENPVPGQQVPGSQNPSETPGQQTPTENPGQQVPGNQKPGEQGPGNSRPGQQVPGNQRPGEGPGNQRPGQQVPGTGEQGPGNQKPGEQGPGNSRPGEQSPTGGRSGESQNSLCDKYTTQIFKDNSNANQKMLLVKLINTVIIGNYTPGAMNPVPGILAEGEFNGNKVNLKPKFDGSLATTNVNGVATAGINFLDGGGADPLMKDLPANDQNSRQFGLLTHLYQFFGQALGCSQQKDGTDFTLYNGKPSMLEVHRFMNINADSLGYFTQQVGLAAKSFGVTDEDVNTVANLLNTVFNVRCAKPSSPFPPLAGSQGFCLGKGCPLAQDVDPECAKTPEESVPKTDNNGTPVYDGSAPVLASQQANSAIKFAAILMPLLFVLL